VSSRRYVAGVTDAFVETPAEPAGDRHQLVAAIILGLAATLTAFSAYQGSLEDGESLQGYTASTRTLNDANAFYAEANQVFALDQQLFVQFATAAQEGNAELAEYLLTLMRPGLLDAVTWWEATDDAITPFDELAGNPYEVPQQEEAIALEQQAAAEFEEGADANERGDQFGLSTVLFALTLFFGGIATLFGRPAITVGLLAVAMVTLVVGVVALVAAY
jgi:hypothetical protein